MEKRFFGKFLLKILKKFVFFWSFDFNFDFFDFFFNAPEYVDPSGHFVFKLHFL